MQVGGDEKLTAEHSQLYWDEIAEEGFRREKFENILIARHQGKRFVREMLDMGLSRSNLANKQSA
jgi:hypothetical protein